MQVPDNWTFKSDQVAENFDEHVSEQLPWYGMAIDLTAHIARCYLNEDAVLLDLGCSTGAITRALSETIADRNVKALSIDNSQQMIDNFNGCGESRLGDMLNTEDLPRFDVCVVFLALMFTDVKTRPEFLFELEKKANPGGAIIIIDRFLPLDGYLGLSIGRMSIKNKFDAGANSEQIVKKELSLCGVQRPTDRKLMNNFKYQQWLQVGDFCGYAKEV